MERVEMENESMVDPCVDLVPRHEFIGVKFAFLSVIGSSIALFGIFGNLTTAAVMTRHSMRRSSNHVYLASLAIFDTLLLFPSIMLYSLEPVSEYFDRPDMYVIWIQWVPHCFALSNFAQTGSVYITVSATFERCLAVLYPKYAEIQCNRQKAIQTIIGVICFSALFTCTKYFEIVVYHHFNCTGFSAYELVPSDLLKHPLYATVYTLWLSQFVMVFLPFVILLTTNTMVVLAFRRSLKMVTRRDTSHRKVSVRCHDGSEVVLERNTLKEQSRDATRVLVTIVSVFLICNSLGFVVTLLENIYSPGQLSKWAPRSYAFSRDAINLLAIVNSSINFVVCCIFGEDFRCEMAAMYGCKSYRKRLVSQRRLRYFGNNVISKRSMKKRINGAMTKKPMESGVQVEPADISPIWVKNDQRQNEFYGYRAHVGRGSMFAVIL